MTGDGARLDVCFAWQFGDALDFSSNESFDDTLSGHPAHHGCWGRCGFLATQTLHALRSWALQETSIVTRRPNPPCNAPIII